MDFSDFDFGNFVRIWARLALLLIFVEAYLTVNKIWIRKHEPVVSESVSVSAQLIALTTGLPFVVLYWIEGAYEGSVGDGVFLVVNLIMILIGIGFWVEGRRDLGFWHNLRKSLNLERSEAAVMAKDIFRPYGARQVIRILHHLAFIDNQLDERERLFIESFAEKWNINLAVVLPQETNGDSEGAHSYTHLRKLVLDYLAMLPPPEQARQLCDLLKSLTLIDERVSEEEQLMMDELSGILGDYAGDANPTRYAVFVAPQNPGQEDALIETLPGLKKERRLGGEVFRIGAYYSSAYADMVCDRYRATGYLTVRERDAG